MAFPITYSQGLLVRFQKILLLYSSMSKESRTFATDISNN